MESVTVKVLLYQSQASKQPEGWFGCLQFVYVESGWIGSRF